MAAPTQQAFAIAGIEVAPGKRCEATLPLPRLAAGPEAGLPLIVMHGRKPGPTVWLSAAIHGDELNGVEIVRRVVRSCKPHKMAGTLIAAPVVNVFGVSTESRYLPDRRDLNRCFPGTRKGSLASRLAYLFMTEVVSRCTVGIDLHTGSDHRFNLPQIRADLTDPEIRHLATAFGATAAMSAKPRPGSLRAAAASRYGARVLLYEGGVSMQFDEGAIVAGAAGVLRVLGALGMVPTEGQPPPPRSMVPARTQWIRASRGGFLLRFKKVGDEVAKGEVLGEIHDAVGKLRRRLRAPADGVLIGQLLHPMVYQGDAVVHLALSEGATWLDASEQALAG